VMPEGVSTAISAEFTRLSADPSTRASVAQW
jgi:hypothetical protein